MGYAGINNNLAMEFDILQDALGPELQPHCDADLRNEHQYSRPTGRETIQSEPTRTSRTACTSGAISAVPPMGGSCAGFMCTNGAMHQVVIGYTPPAGHQSNGTLAIWLDNINPQTHKPNPGAPPTITVPYNITGLSLDNGMAWVGFTASQPSQGTAQDILAWEFTPHSSSQVTQVIPPGGTPATYPFGSHDMVVTYPPGFTNPDGILMTVQATPWNRNAFFQQRLLGTQFANESVWCIWERVEIVSFIR